MISLALGLQQFFNAPQLDPNILFPSTSIERPIDRGMFAHTNHAILLGDFRGIKEEYPYEAALAPTYAGPAGFSPSQIRTAYGVPSTGGSGAIAVVIAYHYPNALRDFNVFATQFGLPTQTGTNQTATTNSVFQVVYQGTAAPTQNTGWNQEAAMDIEWTHAMAPSAKIYLVEANSASITDLNAAIVKASSLPGVRAVSMSFGATESTSFSTFDTTVFNKSGVVYFASAGDVGGEKIWPAMSPKVVSVGGTSLTLSGTTATEKAWSGTGGGVSAVFARPSYQSALTAIVGTKRGGPDIAAVADPYTGAAVYAPSNTTTSTWMVFGGTSLSA
ncbi:MAG: hypothetical protein RLZ87_277, partial [Armatimonadota bacterium]